MIFLMLTALLADYATGFRGPHHPKSGVSHHRYSPQKDGLKLTQDTELLHDVSHLKEDMGELAEQLDVSKMNEQELEFYYFNFHDTDNNTKLDGLEMLHAIVHTLHRHEGDEKSDQVEWIVDDMNVELPQIIELIDLVLEEDDLDKDGYLGYIEYALATQRGLNEEARRTKKLNIITQ